MQAMDLVETAPFRIAPDLEALKEVVGGWDAS